MKNVYNLAHYWHGRVPIRVRLTFWYLLSFGVILFTFFGFLENRVMAGLENQADAALRLAANRTLDYVVEDGERLAFQDVEALADMNDDFSVYLLAPDQQTVWGHFGFEDIPVLDAPAESAFFTVKERGPRVLDEHRRDDLRVYHQPIVADDGTAIGWLQIAQDFDRQHTLGLLRGHLCLGAPFALLLAGLAVLSLIAQILLGDLLNASMFRFIDGGVGAGLGLLVGFPSAFMRRPRRAVWIGLLPLGFAFGYLVPALLLLAVTFVIVGVLYLLLWPLIGLVGRFFPARWVDLKLALRAMVATRGRGASTLLALVIGVFTLSLITMLAGAVSNRFEQMLTDEAGGNVIVFASGQNGTLDAIEARLNELEGVNSYTALGAYSVDLIALEDASTGEILSFDELKARVDSKLSPVGFMGRQRGDRLTEAMSDIDARSVLTNLPNVTFYRGRQLTAADAGQPHIVISANDTTLAAGFDVGDKLTFRFTGDTDPIEMTFEIVGMVDRTRSRMEAGPTSPNYAPIDVFPAGLSPDTVNAIVDVDKDQVPALKRAMKDVPGAFVMETRLINDLLNRFIQQFTSFPILVASLALIVGGIVIANSVALSTLERQREIGIMKAVGLQRERVLGMLLLENGVMGLIGGLIGVGIGSVTLIVLITGMFGSALQDVIPYLTALQLMALCVAIALLAAVLTAWGASGEKPLNVLRYE
jgi:putative ABC transport system permease protein